MPLVGQTGRYVGDGAARPRADGNGQLTPQAGDHYDCVVIASPSAGSLTASLAVTVTPGIGAAGQVIVADATPWPAGASRAALEDGHWYPVA